MGDRGNIVVRQDSKTNRDDVWLYTHWGGFQIAEVVHKALKRRLRWTDASYLARIIFCQLVGKHVAGEDGFGISCAIGDNEHPIVVVDVEAKSVFVVPEKRLIDNRLPDTLDAKDATHAWTFEEFIALDALPEL